MYHLWIVTGSKTRSTSSSSTGIVIPSPTSQPKTGEDTDVGKIASITVFVIIIVIGFVILVVVVVVGYKIRRRRRNQIVHEKFQNEVDVTYSSEGPAVSMGAFDNATYGVD